MISVVILTKNSSKTLKETLESTKRFKEVVVYDTGSQDTTLSIAGAFPNVKIFHGKFAGFGKTRNEAAKCASYDWILALDSDEILSESLADAILTSALDPSMVYRFRRTNFFLGEKMRSCSGWGKDYVSRLYNRNHHSYSQDEVHEKILSAKDCERLLPGELLHTPYAEIGDLLKKLQHYSDLFAKEQMRKAPRGVMKAALHSAFAFFKSYIIKLGFLQGARGFIISSYLAHTCFYKYLKVWEKGLSKE